MVKHVPRLFFLLVAIALLLVSASMAWVAHVPRDVSFLIPNVEASLNSTGAHVQVRMEKAHIDWHLWRDFGRISISNVRVMSGNEKVFARLPNIQVKLSALALLTGDIGIDWVIIPRSDLVLTSTADRQLMLGFSSEGNSIPISSLYANGQENADAPMRLPFNNLLIEDANIAIRDQLGKLLLKTYASELSFSRERYGFQGSFRLNFTYRDQVGSTQSLIRYYQRDKSLTAAAKLVNVPIGLICGIAGDCNTIGNLRGAVTGKAAFNLRDGRVADADIVLAGERVRFTQSEWFAEPLEFTRAAISASIAEDMRVVNIRTVDIANNDVRIAASGHAERKRGGWYVDLVAKQNGLNLKNLYKYWPVPLAPGTRTWVTGGITRGHSPEAIAIVKLTPVDFAAEAFPDGFLNATIQVQDATVLYLPGLAPVKGVDGKVHFTGNTMRADVGGGTLLSNTQLTKAVVFCPDLNHPNIPMQTELTLDASSRDVADLFEHKAFAFDDSLNLNKETIQGRVAGQVNLDFNAFGGKASDQDSFDVSGVAYDIAVTLDKVGQKALMGAYDISGFSGKLTADAKGMSLKGAGNMNASPLDLEVTQSSGGDVHVNAKGAMTRSNLVALGMPDRKEIGDGTIRFDAGVVLTKNAVWLEFVMLNLQDVVLTLADISWQKPRGVASTLSLAPLAGEQGNYRITHKGGGLSVSGELKLGAASQTLESLTLAQVKTDKNDFVLNYKATGDAMSVSLSGSKLDNSMAFTSETPDASENTLLANFPKLHLALNIDALLLVPEFPLRQLKGELDCFRGPCVSGNISAQTGEKGVFTANIASLSGKRGLEIKATDTGQLFRTLGVTDKVNGGDLHFDGAYEGDALKGRLIITQFNVKQSQVLARLFSVASLSGLSNLLTGSGIDFEKLRANVTHKQGIFTLSEARANGASVGYTASGSVNTRDSSLNLKGVLVPAYALNSIVGKIPVIGAIAGSEGEGLISFNYSVKGKYDNPEVMVNPLSGLTPGFLRGIFEAGDSDAAAASKDTKGPATPIRERR